MANNSISVVLADSCCNRNYILSKVIGRSVWFRGRKYWFEVTGVETRYDLFCNGHLIGDFYIDEVLVYEEKSYSIKSVDELKTLISMFNLYPC